MVVNVITGGRPLMLDRSPVTDDQQVHLVKIRLGLGLIPITVSLVSSAWGEPLHCPHLVSHWLTLTA